MLSIYDIPSFCDIEGKNAIKAIVVPRVPEEKKIFCWINREFDIIVCESIVGNGRFVNNIAVEVQSVDRIRTRSIGSYTNSYNGCRCEREEEESENGFDKRKHFRRWWYNVTLG